MRKFVIKAFKPAKNDQFHMNDHVGEIFFLALGLNDLTKTINAITPKAARMRSTQFWRSRFVGTTEATALNIFQKPMYTVYEVETPPKVFKSFPYTTKWGFSHELKVVEPENVKLP